MNMPSQRFYFDDVPSPDFASETVEVSIDFLQRVWANLYYDEDVAGFTFQQTLNEVVEILAAKGALPRKQR